MALNYGKKKAQKLLPKKSKPGSVLRVAFSGKCRYVAKPIMEANQESLFNLKVTGSDLCLKKDYLFPTKELLIIFLDS